MDTIMDISQIAYQSSTDNSYELLKQAHKATYELSQSQVNIVDGGKAIEGEVWAPQLEPYEDWAKGPSEGFEQGTDGDLYPVGVLGMGISDERREELVERAKLVRHHLQNQGADATNPSCAAANADTGAAFDSSAFDSSAFDSSAFDKELQSLFSVRHDNEGWALCGVNLRRIAELLDAREGLVVVLPSSIGGVPVVRIAAEAFARRLVQGVGVSLLVIPDSVRSIGAGAFGALSATCVYLGADLEVLGEQVCDLAGVSPRLCRREYAINPQNKTYYVDNGSLYKRGEEGDELVFLASPYPEQITISDSVTQIGSAAFAQGCEMPRVVRCSKRLTRVIAKTFDDAVWICPACAPAYHQLYRRGVRLAGQHALEQDGCWYDFIDGEAVLVAGPPAPASVSKRFSEAAAVRAAVIRGENDRDEVPSLSEEVNAAVADFIAPPQPTDLLMLPKNVSGMPLTRIGVRALPHAPATLIVPDSVRIIERENACRGTVSLTLPEGLQAIGEHCFWSRTLQAPVEIPASVTSVGQGCFEYAICRLGQTGAIVHLSADQLLSCFLVNPRDGIPFDFARYDELLTSGKNLPDRLGGMLHRIATPFRLTETTRDTLVRMLLERKREAMERVAQEGDVTMVEQLAHAGFINAETFDQQIELLRVRNRTDCVLFLMEWHRRQRELTCAESSTSEFVPSAADPAPAKPAARPESAKPAAPAAHLAPATRHNAPSSRDRYAL
ncbi:hypothetical protein D7W09_01080 [bacterium D16-34]|nr:hypothetical protein D7W09_01080 [bacterium D16-34]